MTDRTRLLIFKTMDDVQTPEMLHLMQALYNFTSCDEIFRWLLANGLKGYPLLHWFKNEFKHSAFELAKYTIGKINQEPKNKIIYGQDWKGL